MENCIVSENNENTRNRQKPLSFFFFLLQLLGQVQKTNRKITSSVHRRPDKIFTGNHFRRDDFSVREAVDRLETNSLIRVKFRSESVKFQQITVNSHYYN